MNLRGFFLSIPSLILFAAAACSGGSDAPTPTPDRTATPAGVPIATVTRVPEGLTETPFTPTAVSTAVLETPAPEPTATPAQPTPTEGPSATETPPPSPTPQPDLAFYFDEDLTLFEQTLIITAIEVTRDLLAGDAGVTPLVSVFAYHDVLTLEQEFLQHARAQNWRAQGMADRLRAGIAEASYRGVVVNAGGEGWEGLRDSVIMRAIAHEYVHVVQLENTGLNIANATLSTPPAAVPPAGPFWLLEGSAEVISYLVMQELDLANYAETIAQTGIDIRGDSTRLGDMESYVGYLGGLQPGLGRSALAVDYLLRNRDVSELFNFWEDIGRGFKWEDAFVRRFGTPVETFYNNFEQYYTATWGN